MSNACAIKFPRSEDAKYIQIVEYLSQEGRYWIENDEWDIRDAIFKKIDVSVADRFLRTLDFSGFANEPLKNEAKFYVVFSLKNKRVSGTTFLHNYRHPLHCLAQYMTRHNKAESFRGVDISGNQREFFLRNNGVGASAYVHHRFLWDGLISFITDYYDEREEIEKDIWYAANIPGVKRSAVERGGAKPCLNFTEIPTWYRETVKRFLLRLVARRSWSYCAEMLTYIKYFFKVFYAHGYTDGFFEALTRHDIEKYLLWMTEYHKSNNATYRSKSVSFIRHFVDYIQLAEYPNAPNADVDKLIYIDDFPRRESAVDTFQKIKYIPAPVIGQIDASVNEIEPKEFLPVYILLRETGWRGADVLNLRYDNCIDYQWNAKEMKYVGYLCGEITKTGIPQLKIPVRDEVAEMIKRLADAAGVISTKENNPDKYLFNVYEGVKGGLPLSKAAFVGAMKKLIEKKGIRGEDGGLYHFKTHSLRHTRALEYTRQGMPIGAIQQILGHCSLQMTLHYAKVSENALYEKWKETEQLKLFHIGITPPEKSGAGGGIVQYENIRPNLDAVKVPFGACFKPTKLHCKQQAKHCLECPNFCSTKENIPEYENEIKRVAELINVSVNLGRTGWVENNREYLDNLEAMLERIRTEGVVHKNGSLREKC
jgi:integrase